jgi:hypothetical protein
MVFEDLPEGALRDDLVIAVFIARDAGTAGLTQRESGRLKGVLEGYPDLKEVARLVTSKKPNSYPRLPIREDRDVCLWLVLGEDPRELRELSAELGRSVVDDLILKPSVRSACLPPA